MIELYNYIDNFVGTRLAEYEVFVWYYRELTGSLRNAISPLIRIVNHISISQDSRLWIAEYGMNHSDTQLLLALIAMQLHSGNTSSFYEMLEFMQDYEQDIKELGTEVKHKVKKFDQQDMSSGM